MKLGIVYKEGKIINHRSLVKVLLNPVLRYFGFHIGTKSEEGKLGKPVLTKTERAKTINWESYGSDYDFIEKRRIII